MKHLLLTLLLASCSTSEHLAPVDILPLEFEDGTPVMGMHIQGDYFYRTGHTVSGDCIINRTKVVDIVGDYAFIKLKGTTETCSGKNCEHCAFKDTGGCTCKNIGQGVCSHTISKIRDILRRN